MDGKRCKLWWSGNEDGGVGVMVKELGGGGIENGE